MVAGINWIFFKGIFQQKQPFTKRFDTGLHQTLTDKLIDLQ